MSAAAFGPAVWLSRTWFRLRAAAAQEAQVAVDRRRHRSGNDPRHCGVPSVGPDGFGETAQGQFCLVNVTVMNVGKSPEVFNDFTPKAYDANGTELSPNSGAGVWVNKGGASSTFLQSINPGNTVRGTLIFDVPKGTTLSSIVLHESEFTAGVKVPLSEK
jgi:hypothetical protein